MIDADNPQWTDETFAKAKPASEVLPAIFPADLAAQMLKPKRTRGPGKRPTKASTTLRLPPETLERWKASGPGWQTRMAELLSRRAP
ncbi:BrnA antitoxin family protein [Xanthomonas oryzae pv. oryzicola]|nr:BrnA antitoxin family protein [Xanthomonas oryzae]MEC5112200.1 BrnA antitoxin family protein [Xanthomonas oryzae pv. oryzicola]